LTSLLDLLFPELQYLFKTKIHSRAIYSLLKKHPSAEEIAALKDDEISNLLYASSKGHFKKAGVGSKRHLREFKVANIADYQLAGEINVDVFAVGDKVDAVATSKGKGFQGPIKRHGQSRGPETHGSHYHRGPGSMGMCSDPSRVFKGKKLAGHMGFERTTIKNLEVVLVDKDKNLVLVKGSVPGPKKGLVILKEAHK